MGEFMDTLKTAWLFMIEPPWQHSGTDDKRSRHWRVWLIGWAWALAGLVCGALYAPWIVQVTGLAHGPYLDWLVIGIAVLAGFITQFLGWCLVSVADTAGEAYIDRLVMQHSRSSFYLYMLSIGLSFLEIGLGTVFAAAATLLPFIGIGYALYIYFTLLAANQRSVTVAFVGGLLVKTFLIPFIKGLATGAAFKVLMTWLRGGKKKGT